MFRCSQNKVIGLKQQKQQVSRAVKCAKARQHKQPWLTAHKQLALAAFQRLLLMTDLDWLIIQPGLSHPDNFLDTPISYISPLTLHIALYQIDSSGKKILVIKSHLQCRIMWEILTWECVSMGYVKPIKLLPIMNLANPADLNLSNSKSNCS